MKIQLVYVPNSAYMDGTKLPTAFASGAVQHPRAASYSVSSRTPLAKAILDPPRPSPTCSSPSATSSARCSPSSDLPPSSSHNETSCSRAPAASLGTTSPIPTIPASRRGPRSWNFIARSPEAFHSARNNVQPVHPVASLGSSGPSLASAEAEPNHAQPLAEIAYACAFRDTAHFSRTFHFRFGCTPSAASEGHISGNELMRHTRQAERDRMTTPASRKRCKRPWSRQQ